MADFLTLADLSDKIGQQRIVQFFDDDADGVVDGADSQVAAVLEAAEAMYYSRLKRAYPGRQTLIDLANADPAVKSHVAWIACELAAERRLEFTSAEGWGAFKVQYDRALSELDLLSKGATRSIGETTVGKGANTGGKIQPKPPVGEADQFVFASSKARPGGTGGF